MDIFNESTKTSTRILSSLFCLTMVSYCVCTEEFQREILIGPRHFNPHPYQQQLARIQDPGPVTFPKNEEEETRVSNNKYNIVTVNRERIKEDDNDVYSKVAQKIKFLINRKYSASRENQIIPDVYNGLAHQGASILPYPPQEIPVYGNSPILRKKNNYAFAYKVLDKGSGDDFSHQQTRSAKTTNGEYRVKLPDGRIQIVSYKADKDGYKADVRYEDDPEFTHQNLIHPSDIQNVDQYVGHNVDGDREKFRPVLAYDYSGNREEQQLVSPLTDRNVVVLEQAAPTQIPVKYIGVTPTPSPSPATYLVDGYKQQYYPKVQVYTTNVRDDLQENYVHSTTAVPYGERNIIRYTSTPVPEVQAKVNHVGDHGIYIPISSTFAPPIRQISGNYKNVIARPDEHGRIGGSPQHQSLAQENELPEGIYIVGKTGKRK